MKVLLMEMQFANAAQNNVSALFATTGAVGQHVAKPKGKKRKPRLARAVRERLAEARKYAPLADCNDGL